MPDSPTITLSVAQDSAFDHAITLAQAVAWPLALLVVALLFRAQIVALAHRLDELRWGDKSARFTRRLDRIERAGGPVAEADSALALSGDHARFLQLLELSPAAAVLDSWARVEQARTRLARRGRADALNRRTRAALADLAMLREQAAHGHPVTIPDALRFRTLAKRAVNETNLA